MEDHFSFDIALNAMILDTMNIYSKKALQRFVECPEVTVGLKDSAISISNHAKRKKRRKAGMGMHSLHVWSPGVEAYRPTLKLQVWGGTPPPMRKGFRHGTPLSW